MVERLGVFGGTFDPVHVGHLACAEAARAALHLDRVLLVVAADPWQKRGGVVASARDRFDMVAAAVAGSEHLEASAVEIDRPGATYTADTLRQLSAPERELFLIVGADVATSLGTWQRLAELPALARLVVVDRAGERPPDVTAWSGPVRRIAMAPVDLSSTALRERIRSGRSVEGMIPPPTARLLAERHLYTAGR